MIVRVFFCHLLIGFWCSCSPLIAGDILKELQDCTKMQREIEAGNYTKAAEIADKRKCPQMWALAQWLKFLYGERPQRTDERVRWIREGLGFLDAPGTGFTKSIPGHQEILKRMALIARRDMPKELLLDLLKRLKNPPPEMLIALKGHLKPQERNRLLTHLLASGTISEAQLSRLLEHYAAQIRPLDAQKLGARFFRAHDRTALKRLVDAEKAGRLKVADARRLKLYLRILDQDEQLLSAFCLGRDAFVLDSSSAEVLFWSLLRTENAPKVWSFYQTHKKLFTRPGSSLHKMLGIAARDALITRDYAVADTIIAHMKGEREIWYSEAKLLQGLIKYYYRDQKDEAINLLKRHLKNASTDTLKARYHFWLGRMSTSRVEKNRHLERARNFHLTYHGQLASGALGRPLKIALTPGLPGGRPSRSAHFNHAHALDKMNQPVAATRMLYHAFFQEKGAGRHAFLLAVRTYMPTFLRDFLCRSGYCGALCELYPTEVSTGHRGVLDSCPPRLKSFVRALICKESGFNPYAVSPAGATGLMQVMPETAQRVAGKGAQGRATLFAVKANAEIGISYIRDLLKRYGGARALALAAYNAGPMNVDKWLARYGDPRKNDLDPLLWLELIPFAETRLYVMTVLANRTVYEKILE